MTILDKIVLRKKEIVKEQKAKVPEAELKDFPLFKRQTLSLVASLKNPARSNIITEFKRQSPSKGVINGNADVAAVTIGYTQNGSACLSVLTDADFFGGKSEDLIAARVNEIPILRKDFIVDTYQILEAKAIGADVVLLIAACLTPKQVIAFTDYAHELGLEVLLELYSENELGHIYDKVDLVGINNRNLKTFEVDIHNSIRLLGLLPKDKPAIAESGISHPETVKTLMDAGFYGFLMGEHFMKTDDPAKAFADYYQALKELTDEG
ncbi:MAG: indole-3-glycerol phosphate synthase TrpC [Chitinophagaceae bacterium]